MNKNNKHNWAIAPSHLKRIVNFISSKLGLSPDFSEKGNTSNTEFVQGYDFYSGDCYGVHVVGEKEPFKEEGPTEDKPATKKLVTLIVELIHEYDRNKAETKDEAFINLYGHISENLIESLIQSGCEAINPQNGDPFNFEIHTTQPVSMPDNGEVAQTIRMGVTMNGQILIKAIVELRKDENEIL